GGWPDLLAGDVGLGVDHLAHQHGEAAGGAVDRRLAVGEAGGVEAGEDQLARLLDGAGEEGSRDLLGADLEKQIAGDHHSTSCAASFAQPDWRSGKPSRSRMARYSSAQPRERLRTRRM